MRLNYLFVAPQFGLTPSGEIIPGGLLQLGRCIARALAAAPGIRKLSLRSQVDVAGAAPAIERMLRLQAHPAMEFEIRCFGGSWIGLTAALSAACVRGAFDRVMYGHVNQAQLSALPRHPPHDAWIVGIEVFAPLSRLKRRSLHTAQRVLSISRHTAETAALYNGGIESVQVVPLCAEATENEETSAPYEPSGRDPAVLIVANLHQEYLYKGHQQLIAGWREVAAVCPDAELWIGGSGNGEGTLRKLASLLPDHLRQQIHFLGTLSPESLDERFRRARVFAMPSAAEGFGLVFVEAARYGIPCIGGLYDSVKEILVHGETGLLVEQHPHDVALACIQLLNNDRLAKRLGEAGRRKYLDFYQFPQFRTRLLDALGFDLPAADPIHVDALCASST